MKNFRQKMLIISTLTLLFLTGLNSSQLFGQCTITGPDIICIGSSAAYEIAGSLPVDADIVWNVSPDGAITNSSTDGKRIDVLWNDPGVKLVKFSYHDSNGDLVSCEKQSTIYPSHDNVIHYNSDDFVLTEWTKFNIPAICEGETRKFWVTPYQNSVSWTWSVVGNAQLTPYGPNVDVHFNTLGVHTIVVEEIDENGCSHKSSIDIMVTPKVVVSFDALGFDADPVICKGQNIIFKNTSTGSENAHDFLWTVKNSSNVIVYTTSQKNLNYKFTSPGNYTVTLSHIDLPVCGEPFTRNITVQNEIPIEIICLQTGCEGSPAIYKIQDGCAQINWEVIGGTATSPTNQQEITVIWDDIDPIGYGVLKVIAKCTPDACPGLYYVPVMPTDIEITGLSNLCLGSSQLYSIPVYQGTSYNWTITPINTIAGSLPTINSPTQNQITINTDNFVGSFKLTATATSDNILFDCEAVAEKIITVYNYNVSPLSFCLGDDAILDITPTGMVEKSTWSISQSSQLFGSGMNNGDEIIIPASLINMEYSYSLNIKLTLSNGNTCDLDKFLNIGSNPKPVVQGPDNVCPDLDYLYVASTSPNQTWTVTGGTINGATNQSNVTINWSPIKGLHYVKYTYNTTGCPPSSIYKFISVDDGNPVVISGPKTVCPDQRETYTLPSDVTNVSWSVSNGNGAILSSTTDPQVEIQWINGEGNESVLSVTYTRCGTTRTSTLPITIKQTEILISGPDEACVNQPLSYMLNGISGEIVWIVNGEEIPGAAIQYITFKNAGLQPLQVRVTDPNGCPGVFLGTLWVRVYAEPMIKLHNKTTLDCPDGTVGGQIEVEGDFEESGIKWFLGNNEIAGQNSSILPVTQNGVYTFKITSGPCEYQRSITINNICGVLPPGGCGGCTIQGVSMGISSVTLGPCGKYNISGFMTPVPTPSDIIYWTVPIDGEGTVDIDVNDNSNLTQTNLMLSEPGYYMVRLARLGKGSLETEDPENLDSCITIPITECTQFVYADLKIPFKIDDLFADITCQGSQYSVDFRPHIVRLGGIITQSITYKVDGTPKNLPYLATPGSTVTVEVTVVGPSPGNYTCTFSKTITFPPSTVSSIATTNTQYCINSPIEFHATDITGFGISYDWDFGDTTESHIKDPIKQYSSTGDKTITLTVTDSYGCTSTYTRVITIIANPFTDYDLSASFNECNTEAILSVSPTTNIVSYEWGPGVIPATNPVTVGQNNFYGVKIKNADGCSFKLYKNITSLLPAFFSQINGQSPVCLKSINHSFYFKGAGGFVYEAVLNPGGVSIDLNTSNISNIWLQIPDNTLVPDTYTITVTATKDNMDCGTISRTIVVEGPIVAPALVLDLISCEPYKVTVRAVDNSVMIFDNNVETDLYEVPYGKTSVAAYTIASNSCYKGRSTINIPPKIDFTTFITGCYDVCDTTLTDSSLIMTGIPGTFTSWKWKLDGTDIPGKSGTGTIIPLVLTPSLEGKITLWVSNGLCSDESGAFCLHVQNCHCSTDTLGINFASLNCLVGTLYEDPLILFKGTLVYTHFPNGFIPCPGTLPYNFQGATVNFFDAYYQPGIGYYVDAGLIITNDALLVQNQGVIGSIDLCNPTTGDTCTVPFKFNILPNQLTMCAMEGGLMCMHPEQVLSDPPVLIVNQPKIKTYSKHFYVYLPFGIKINGMSRCTVNTYTVKYYMLTTSGRVLLDQKTVTSGTIPNIIKYSNTVQWDGLLYPLNTITGFAIRIKNNCNDSCELSEPLGAPPAPLVSAQDPSYTSGNLEKTTTTDILSVYLAPNPNNGLFTLRWNGGSEHGSYLVIGSDGKQVASGSLQGKQGTQVCEWNHLPSGVYFIRIRMADQIPLTQKFVIIK